MPSPSNSTSSSTQRPSSLSTSTSVTPNESATPKPPYRESFKRQKLNDKSDSFEREILKSINNVNQQMNQQQPQEQIKDEGPNMHFCKSLAPLLDKLSAEQNMLARIKIQQILYEIQFNKNL